MPIIKPTSPALTSRINLLKSVSRVPCACCGRETLLPSKRQAACTSLEKPLKSVLDRLIPLLKNKQNILKALKKFAEAFPNLSFDKILENPACQNAINNSLKQFYEHKTNSKEKRDELAKKLFTKIRTNATLDLRSASTIMKRLESFKKYLTEDNLQIFEQFEIYAQKYPRKSLSEIVHSDEVYNFHKTRQNLFLHQRNDKFNFHIRNISKIVKRPFKEVSQQFYEIIEKDPRLLHYDNKTKIGKIKNAYKEILAQYNLEERKEEKVLTEIEKLPFERPFVDNFFIRAYEKDYTDTTVVDALINPQERSFEHIIPQISNGKDDVENGIILCRRCNSTRSSIPYSEYLQYHPEMIENTQKQIDYFARLILTGKLEADLMDWPIKVAKTLVNYTDGVVNCDISAYRKKALRKIEKQLPELQKEKKEIKAQQQALWQELDALKIEAEKNRLQRELYNNMINLLKTMNL